VFGYALDGATWDELQSHGHLPDTTLDLDHPFWRGSFWAVYPERTGAAGRNDVSVGDRTLVGVWTDATVASLNDGLADAGRSGASGSLDGLPIVVDHGGDPVHDAGHRIARTVVEQLIETPEGRALLVRFPQEQRQAALVAITHEFIWSVMEQLVADGTVPMPPILAPGAHGPRDPRDLMFVILGASSR
jgi:hypothetical protein